MIILRSLLFSAGMALITPLYALLALCTAPLPRLARYRFISGWSRLMLAWLRVTCNLRYRVEGLENLPSCPAIILAKHQSAWETLAFQEIFPPQAFLLKRELLWIPFFGWGLALTSPIAINRKTGREALKDLLTKGAERLRQGFWVVIFPEGTRIAPGERGKYHHGGARLAVQTGAPVVPVAHNAGYFWGKGSFLKRPGLITVRVGPVLASTGKKPEDLTREAEIWIEQQMADLAPPSYR